MNTRAILSVAVLTCLMSPAAFAQTSTSGTGTTTREPPSSSIGMTSYDQETAILELKAKSGHAFDTAYTEQMRKDHANAIELFSNAANSSQLDPESRQFAKQTLPTLQHHPQLAMQDLPKAGG